MTLTTWTATIAGSDVDVSQHVINYEVRWGSRLEWRQGRWRMQPATGRLELDNGTGKFGLGTASLLTWSGVTKPIPVKMVRQGSTIWSGLAVPTAAPALDPKRSVVWELRGAHWSAYLHRAQWLMDCGGTTNAVDSATVWAEMVNAMLAATTSTASKVSTRTDGTSATTVTISCAEADSSGASAANDLALAAAAIPFEDELGGWGCREISQLHKSGRAMTNVSTEIARDSTLVLQPSVSNWEMVIGGLDSATIATDATSTTLTKVGSVPGGGLGTFTETYNAKMPSGKTGIDTTSLSANWRYNVSGNIGGYASSVIAIVSEGEDSPYPDGATGYFLKATFSTPSIMPSGGTTVTFSLKFTAVTDESPGSDTVSNPQEGGIATTLTPRPWAGTGDRAATVTAQKYHLGWIGAPTLMGELIWPLTATTEVNPLVGNLYWWDLGDNNWVPAYCAGRAERGGRNSVNARIADIVGVDRLVNQSTAPTAPPTAPSDAWAISGAPS